MEKAHKDLNRDYPYLKTIAIFYKLGIEINTTNLRQAFRFYWNGKRFQRSRFSSILDHIELYSQTLKIMKSNINAEEEERMKTAMSDSYRTISRAAALCSLDRAMVRRITENGDVQAIRVKNPYYSSSAPMILIRMSDLRRWMDKNPYAVTLSRKTLERSRKSMETRLRNLRIHSAVYSHMLEDALKIFMSESKRNPVPLLFLLIKLLQLKSTGAKVFESYINDRLGMIAKAADPTSITIREVTDLNETEYVELCNTCSKNALFLEMTAEQYASEVGKCRNCITHVEIKQAGRHYELLFLDKKFSFIFVITAALYQEMRHSLPVGVKFSKIATVEEEDQWSNIPESALRFTASDLVERIDSLLGEVDSPFSAASADSGRRNVK